MPAVRVVHFPCVLSFVPRPMNVVFGLGTRLRLRMRTKLESGVLHNEPQSTVEPLYNGHLWGSTFRPLKRGVPNSGASGIFPVGVVLRNPAVEYNVAAFSELSYAAR